MSVSFWQDLSKYKNQKIISKDVIIVGGGIAGLSTAFWLKHEDPSLSIAVLEKGAVGSGATGRNAGFITCGSVEHYNRMVEKHGESQAKEIWKFSEENLKLLNEYLLKGHEGEVSFQTQGSFSLASTNEEFKELKRAKALMSSHGVSVETLEVVDIKKRLHVEGFVGGIKYCDDASIDPIALLSLMRKKLEAGPSPVEFYEHNEVFELSSKSDTQVVVTQAHTFEGQAVVLATNAYSSLIDSYFENKIYPTRGQILITEKVPLFMEGPCYANFVLDYFRQLPTGEVIIGGFRQLQKDAEVGFSDQTTFVIQKALEDFLHLHIPHLRGKKVTHRWSGVMGFSADGQPLVGSLPTNPQVYFLGGFTAHGLGLAFHCAKTLSQLIFGQSPPQWLSARRF